VAEARLPWYTRPSVEVLCSCLHRLLLIRVPAIRYHCLHPAPPPELPRTLSTRTRQFNIGNSLANVLHLPAYHSLSAEAPSSLGQTIWLRELLNPSYAGLSESNSPPDPRFCQ
jgi:hypothetical protein